MFELTPLVIPAIPIVIGLVAIVKEIGISTRWLPLFAILLGLGLITLADLTWQATVVQGLIVGLSASGLYDLGKVTVVGK